MTTSDVQAREFELVDFTDTSTAKEVRMSLKGKVALVTGSSRGIGRGIALRLANDGANIVVNYCHNEDLARQTAAEIRAKDVDAEVIRADVGNRDDVENMFARIKDRFGSLHILVNNAGVAGLSGSILEISFDAWQRSLDVNLTGVFLCSQAAARLMVEKGIPGRIINIGSINSFKAQKDAPNYVATKGAIPLLTMAMAVELSSHGILVNAIAPGIISPPKWVEDEVIRNIVNNNVPLKRMGAIEEVAALVAFLASDECAYIQGETILIDGGYLAYLRFD